MPVLMLSNACLPIKWILQLPAGWHGGTNLQWCSNGVNKLLLPPHPCVTFVLHPCYICCCRCLQDPVQAAADLLHPNQVRHRVQSDRHCTRVHHSSRLGLRRWVQFSDDNEIFFEVFPPMSLSLAPEWGLPLLVEWSM
jgi:hypothetical protein